MSSLEMSNSARQFLCLSNLLRSICYKCNTYSMQRLEPVEQRPVVFHKLVEIDSWYFILQLFSIPKLGPISVKSGSFTVRAFPIAQSSRVEPLWIKHTDVTVGPCDDDPIPTGCNLVLYFSGRMFRSNLPTVSNERCKEYSWKIMKVLGTSVDILKVRKRVTIHRVITPFHVQHSMFAFLFEFLGQKPGGRSSWGRPCYFPLLA